MIVFDDEKAWYHTPKGAKMRFTIRIGTNDHNTVYSAANSDEYGLAPRSFAGVAFDIGAHIGSVAVPLAMDNPELTVLAVEPVQANADLCWMNARDNGVADRVRVILAAAGPPGVTETKLHAGFRGSEIAWHHAFIGTTEQDGVDVTAEWRAGDNHEITTVISHDFGTLVGMAGAVPSFVKIDCEGAEYGILSHPQVAQVPLIIGEWHNVPLHGKAATQGDLRALLPGHDVTFSGPEAGPGGFVATLR